MSIASNANSQTIRLRSTLRLGRRHRLADGHPRGERQVWHHGHRGIGEATENCLLKELYGDDSPKSQHDETSSNAAFLPFPRPRTGVTDSLATAHHVRTRRGAQLTRNSLQHCRVVERLTDRLSSKSSGATLRALCGLVDGTREIADSQVRLKSPDILSPCIRPGRAVSRRFQMSCATTARRRNNGAVRSHGCGR
jgi:hypothetical protein